MDLDSYDLVKHSIHELLNIDLNQYKDRQMRRRLGAWLQRVGASDWETYFAHVRVDQDARKQLREYLTINVSSFFRDPDRWQILQTQVLPSLLQLKRDQGSSRSGLRIWSAGCSIGAEPYSLAMALEELAPDRKHDILATDIDPGALAIARVGGPYRKEDTTNISKERLERHFSTIGAPHFVKSNLQKWIRFDEHDMLKDEFGSDFDLILCRNVVIYFTPVVRDELYRRFRDSLKPGGIFFAGGTEFILRPAEMGFRHQGTSMYVRT